jgi:hypothetical protein
MSSNRQVLPTAALLNFKQLKITKDLGKGLYIA